MSSPVRWIIKTMPRESGDQLSSQYAHNKMSSDLFLSHDTSYLFIGQRLATCMYIWLSYTGLYNRT